MKTHTFEFMTMDKKKKIEGKGKIFVSIPCYRDNEILKTIQTLIHSADQPDKLVIGIFL